MKTCTQCNLLKSFDAFHLNSYSRDGFRAACKRCIVLASKRYYESNKQAVLKRTSDYTAAHRTKTLSYMSAYAKQHRNAFNEAAKRFAHNNPGKLRERLAKRRAQKLNATPNWLSDSQLQEIKQVYLLAQELSWLSESPLEVDHIVPLQGKNKKGLHVPWNLQILPKSMNTSKGNK